MLIVLNGYPGVGKTTIGTELIKRINGRLQDVHSVYNVAFALTDFRTDAFYETVRDVQQVADARILKLPLDVPVVLTEILTEPKGAASDFWSAECWKNLLKLAEDRGPLLMVHLHCDLPENRRRIASEDRALKRKPREPEMAERNHSGGAVLSGRDCEYFLPLDVTDLTAAAAADVIAKRAASIRG